MSATSSTLIPPAPQSPQPMAPRGNDRRATSRMIRRLTRRDLRRSRGRSVLIVSFFAAPLAFMVFVLWASSIGSSGARDSEMGDATAILVPFADTDPRPPAVANDPARSLVISTTSVTASVGGVSVPLTAFVLDQSDTRLGGLIEPVGGTKPGAGQVTLTRAIATRLHLGVGDKLTINQKDYAVADIVRANETLDGVLVPAGHPLAADATIAKVLLFGPPLTQDQRSQLGAEGWDYRAGGGAGTSGDQATTAVLALALSLLFSVGSASLASVAFAVGARQQRRTLAVIASVGATRDTLQRLVLTAAWRLGLLGTSIGIALGLALVYALHLEAQSSSPRPREPFEFPWWMLAIPAVSTLIAALVSGWLPARWVTKQEALQAVRSSEAPTQPARFPRVGMGLAIAGVAIAAVPLVTGVRKNTAGDGFLNPTMVIFPAVGATVLLFVATVLSSGWLLQRLGRTKWRGLGVRLAFRDAVRHRGRATSAVVATLAISMLAGALLTIGGSLSTTLIRDYQPTYPVGRASLYLYDQKSDGRAAKAAEATVVATLGTPKATWRSSSYGQNGTHLTQREGSYSQSALVTVGDAAGVEFWTGRPITPEVADALARGLTVVFDARHLSDGKVTIDLVDETGAKPLTTPAIYVPGVVGSRVPVLMPAATAKELGLPAPAPGPVFYDFGRPMSFDDYFAVQDNLGPAGFQADWALEAGSSSNLTYLRYFGLAFSIILLVVAVIVSLLTLVDARANYATLAQIGAARGTLRRIAATQAWITSATGTVLGLLAGWLPAWLVIVSSRNLLVPVLPWRWALVMVVGVPVVAAVVTALVARPPRAAATRVQ